MFKVPIKLEVPTPLHNKFPQKAIKISNIHSLLKKPSKKSFEKLHHLIIICCYQFLFQFPILPHRHFNHIKYQWYPIKISFSMEICGNESQIKFFRPHFTIYCTLIIIWILDFHFLCFSAKPSAH